MAPARETSHDGGGPAFARGTRALQAAALSATVLGCWWLYSRGISIPARFSLLNGPLGVGVGVVGVVLGLAARPPLRLWLVAGWLCIWFTAGLAELRKSAITDGTVLGGMIPYSDAGNYLREASRVIEGHDMTGWGSRRPLADAYLAGNLYIAGNNVALSLALAGVLSAAAIALAAVELRKCLGLPAAALWSWLLLVYCRRYFGEMMSEQAGIAFGALGVALLVRAFAGNAMRCLWAGLFVLGLALSARAGALLVLPALVAAAAWRWRSRGPVRVMTLAALSVAAAFAIGVAFVKLIGEREGKILSNYHNVIYGVVFGGNWQKAAADIPNYGRMDESAQAAEVYRRVGAAVRAHPSLIWRGAARNWSDFFTRSDAALGPYSFFRSPATEHVLLILSGIGLLWSMALSDRVAPLILAAGVGVVLSVPFVPTPDADLMRAYAATMPLMVLIPAFSVAGWRPWIRRLFPGTASLGLPDSLAPDYADRDFPDRACWACPFVAVMILVPLLARFVAPLRPAVALVTRGSDTVLTLDLSRASWIELTPPGDSGGADLRRVPAEKLKGGIFGMFRDFYPGQARALDSVSRPGVALICSGSTDTAFLAIDARHLSAASRKITVLGRAISTDSNYDPTFMEDSVAMPGVKK
jgi:hypothetical protein